uniref:Autophagy-related protein 9 n=1 Tax=Corethron hystrix TaxID=216773 RepID=A0A7S1BL35_9STRA|mmetsp:Transcript_32573/g.74951  ORF Transcript_32573/g.74951 Transcript_32573/m.74951 type:complete len:521 (+) Transcript_32573:502-2064(+)
MRKIEMEESSGSASASAMSPPPASAFPSALSESETDSIVGDDVWAALSDHEAQERADHEARWTNRGSRRVGGGEKGEDVRGKGDATPPPQHAQSNSTMTTRGYEGGGSAGGDGGGGERKSDTYSASLLAHDHLAYARMDDDGMETGLPTHTNSSMEEDHLISGAAAAVSDFVFLRNIRRQIRNEGWGAVPDLDHFFKSIYKYYYHRGAVPLVADTVVEAATLLFTSWMSVVLFVYVDWEALRTCRGADTCRKFLSEYFIDRPFSKVSLWMFLVLIYVLLVSGYCIISLVRCYRDITDAYRSKKYFEDHLGISERQLEGGCIEWDDVVSKVVELQRSGEHRVAIHAGSGDLDALVIAQRILRRENFLVAMLNCEVLELQLPFDLPWPLKGFNKPHLSASLEWSLHLCVMNFLFNHKMQLRPSFVADPESLKWRFLACGIAQAIFLPFLLYYSVMIFFLSNMYELKKSDQPLGPRHWTLLAQWKFREFNELPVGNLYFLYLFVACFQIHIIVHTISLLLLSA